MENAMNKKDAACGNHRGCPPPDLDVIQEKAKEYSYAQYEDSMTHLTELCMMISMDFPPELIRDLSSRKLAIWDLDFVRIIYFILRDERYIRERILEKESYVYEDVLEDAVGEAVKKKYPEFTDVETAYEKYKSLEKMADERIRFIDLQNEKLRKEIRGRQEEKQLKGDAAALELERLRTACADRDETISILTENAADLESEKKGLQREIAELVEEKESLSNALKSERGRVSALEDGIKSLRKEMEEQENKEQASIKESLDAVSADIKRVLAGIDKLSRARPKKGFFGIFGDASSEMQTEERPCGPNDEFVRSILTDPDLTKDQYRLLIYCVEAGLPVREIREIADTKVDIERMEFLARWYFRKNGLAYKYEAKMPETDEKARERAETMEHSAKEEEA